MKCKIPACDCSNTLKNCPLGSFHKIPKDPGLRRSWLVSIIRSDHFIVNSAVVCGCHFTEECFHPKSLLPEKGYKRVLKKDSVPTLFLRGKETTWIREEPVGKNENIYIVLYSKKSPLQKIYETKSKQKKIKE
jgi:hypothetical protein